MKPLVGQSLPGCLLLIRHWGHVTLEGGFDNEGTFFYIPFASLQSMGEVFRCRVIKLLVEREILNPDFAQDLFS